MRCCGLTVRLTCRRRGGGWSAETIIEFARRGELKGRAAVRCSGVVKPGLHFASSLCRDGLKRYGQGFALFAKHVVRTITTAHWSTQPIRVATMAHTQITRANWR